MLNGFIIINAWKSLTIVTKNFILDVAGVLEASLYMIELTM